MKDVVLILYENCVMCYWLNNIVPMMLLDYVDVCLWVWSIKDLVVVRVMLLWLVDLNNSMKFRNECYFEQCEIEIIVVWVDGGVLKGNDVDLFVKLVFLEGWIYEGGELDYVFELLIEYMVAVEGEEDYIDFLFGDFMGRRLICRGVRTVVK